MTGTIAPYNMINDNAVMTIFILNIIGISYVFVMNGASILERIKCMFYYESKNTPFNERTHITTICNIILYGQTIFYATTIASELLIANGTFNAGHGVMGLFGMLLLIFLSIMLFKLLSYETVNYILFSKEEAKKWRNIYFFTIKLLGFALAPAALTLMFAPDRYINFVKIYLLFVLFAYICTVFNNLIRIIFTQRRNYLDIFLYLCALEFLPMGIVWKLVLELSEFLTIKI